MLVLTRKPGQVVRVGEEIRVTVLEIKGKHVRLGIDAPPSISIYREELYRAIREGKSKDVSGGEAKDAPRDEDT